MAAPVRVLLTQYQLERFGDRFAHVAPGASFLAMAPDGTISVDGDALGASEAGETIAFASTDLFDLGDDATREHVRSFFVHLLQSSSVEWIHVAAAGLDAPVFSMLFDKGIRLTTSHHTAVPISEYVLAQVLRARLPLRRMDADQRDRRWRGAEWDELASSRWLVLGTGAIGCEVATRARAFGAHVTGVRRTPTGREPVDVMIGPDRVADALPDHDVVVLSLPATPETEGLVDLGFLARLAPETLLVNVGRGALIDEDALRESLDRAQPALAVLDVASTEPLPEDHWLWGHPRVVLTAHTSAGGRQRYERAAEVFAQNLDRFLSGDPLLDEVPPSAAT